MPFGTYAVKLLRLGANVPELDRTLAIWYLLAGERVTPGAFAGKSPQPFANERYVMATRSATLMLTVEEAAQELRIGRTRMFALIGSGDLGSVKIGRSRRVPRAALDAYIAKLAGEQVGAAVA